METIAKVAGDVSLWIGILATTVAWTLLGVILYLIRMEKKQGIRIDGNPRNQSGHP